MTPERWQQVEEVLQQALDLPEAERATFLREACRDDHDLRAAATSLIDAFDRAGDFIETPAITQDATVLAGELPDLNLGRSIGSYHIMEHLGSGGMGEVYLAEDSRLKRLVALKILPTSLVCDSNQLRRFQNEARAVSALNHPNVLTIHEVGEVDNTRFIATEFIDGDTLRELIDQGGLNLGEITDISLQVCAALVTAHQVGIVHRDVKPENIMRRRDGLVKVLDFGIAKPLTSKSDGFLAGAERTTQTEFGVVLGTVGYMSPEQARGLVVDERTDVWSFGVVLYELLTGRPPFAGATRMDTLVEILERHPPTIFDGDASTNRPLCKLEQIVTRCLCKDRSDRYATASSLLADLSLFKEDLERESLKDKSLPLKTPDIAHSAVASGISSTKTRPLLQVTTFASKSFRWLLAGLAVVAIAVLLWSLGGQQVQPTVTDANNAAGNQSERKFYGSMTEEEKLRFISEAEQQISAMMGDRHVKLSNEALVAIKTKVDRYFSRASSSSSEPGAEQLKDIYRRAPRYIPSIARAFAARKVPITIGIYLPMIEAEYRPCFENEIGAKGLFQFLPSTAQQYGVPASEMCNEQKMTPAAAHYLADRMAELGEDSQSLTLVLLSYNRGPEWVRDTLRDLRNTENFQRNFWTMFAHRNELDETFRRENAGYVPMFFAAAIIGENPDVFGLETPPLSSLAGEVRGSL